jgi:hypothetical protein
MKLVEIIMRKIAIAGIIFLVIGVGGCSSGPDMKEGKWEITAEVSMKGIPMRMPAMTHEQCLTKEELIPQEGQQAAQNCTISDQKTSGDTVSWNVVCKDGSMESKSDGAIIYHDETFEGTINMIMNGGPVSISSTNTITGKYLGPCE